MNHILCLSDNGEASKRDDSGNENDFCLKGNRRSGNVFDTCCHFKKTGQYTGKKGWKKGECFDKGR